MALITDTDLDNMLWTAGGGDTATIGTDVVPCMIGAEDTEELQDKATRKAWGNPVSMDTHATIVTVRTGTLSGLTPGATVTLRGVDYTVDRIQRMRIGDLTHFLAYPKS